MLMALPLIVLFLYTLPFFAPALNAPMLLLLLVTPFISHALPERRRAAFYFLVEMIFLISVLGLLFGTSGTTRAFNVYSVIVSGEIMLPFVFAVEVLRSKQPAQALSSLIVGMGLLLNEIAAIAFAQANRQPILSAYISVWSLQIQGTISLLEKGYQSQLPLQTLSIAVSPVILALLITAAAGFVLFVLFSGGNVDSVRAEQAAGQIAYGAVATLVVLGAVMLFSGAGLAITMISAGVLAICVVILRIAKDANSARRG